MTDTTAHAKVAARHHTTLNTFGAVVALLESGLVYDPAAYATSQKIVDLCRKQMQAQLRKYDAALSKIAGATHE